MHNRMMTWKDGFRELKFSIMSSGPMSATLCFEGADLLMVSKKAITGVCKWFAQHHVAIGLLEYVQEYAEEYRNLANFEEAARLIYAKALDPHVEEIRLDALRSVENAKERSKLQQVRTKSAEVSANSYGGWVYVLEADNGTYKIGMTKLLDKRVASLSVELPYELELVTTIHTDNALGLESELHKRFADKNIKGEWFDLDEADLAFIDNLKAEYEQGEAEHESTPAPH